MQITSYNPNISYLSSYNVELFQNLFMQVKSFYK